MVHQTAVIANINPRNLRKNVCFVINIGKLDCLHEGRVQISYVCDSYGKNCITIEEPIVPGSDCEQRHLLLKVQKGEPVATYASC